MSRRAARRKSLSQGGQDQVKSRVRGRSNVGVGKWLMRIVAILAASTILAGFGVYSWVQSYLRSDDFRVFISESVGGVMGAEAEFGPLEWQGMDVGTDGFYAQSNGLMKKVDAEGLRARLSLDGVHRGVWEISGLRISKLKVDLATARSQDANGSLDRAPEAEIVEAAQEEGRETGKHGGFLSWLLPDRAELVSAEVMSMDLNLTTAGGGLTATDTAMQVEMGNAAGSFNMDLSGGTIESPWFGSPLDLISARCKYQRGRLHLLESRSKVYERGLLLLDGEVQGDKFGFYGVLNDVRSEEVVPEDWQKRIAGDLEVKFKVRSGKKGAVTQGEIDLKRGVLTALPVLDRIAAYANSRRFRRINLSEAHLKFRREGARLDLTEIVMASEGLVRVVGSLTIVDGKLDGRFKVGVMPGTLAHIPGAESKVFLRGDKGLLWSPLHITGTVDNPKEDLSDRMIAAAGERMFELVPETGMMALKFAHDSATKLPQKAVESGVDVIREGRDVIQEGVRSALDLLPGGAE